MQAAHDRPQKIPTHYLAPCALLPDGWANDVDIVVAGDEIIGVTPNADMSPSNADRERIAGPVIPGMANLHSHAFQRAMAGLAETAGPQGDSFWAWRELMYQFLDRLTPDHIEAIAAWLYVEMLEAGYTSVAEFHYLHHDPLGQPYQNRAETALRIVRAAEASGIGLTLLPVLYTHGNFGSEAPSGGQKRFLHDTEHFVDLVLYLASGFKGSTRMRIGVAPHSLRAVHADQLRTIVALARDLGSQTPIHMHVAEQMKEVHDCVSATGKRPMRWLLDEIGLNPNWCVVHATHLSPDEVRDLAASGAVAGLCPSTEGDLGDGFFQGVSYLTAGGRFGIGGDSHALVDPFMELRLFEYGQRLIHQRRNLLASTAGESLGGRLFRGAAQGGAQALAQATGAIAVGHRADLVVLDAETAALAGKQKDAILDSAIFGPSRALVRDVMVAGLWAVQDGHHRRHDELQRNYSATLKELLA